MNSITEIKLKRKLISLIKKGNYIEALHILNNMYKEDIAECKNKDNPWGKDIYRLERGL